MRTGRVATLRPVAPSCHESVAVADASAVGSKEEQVAFHFERPVDVEAAFGCELAGQTVVDLDLAPVVSAGLVEDVVLAVDEV